MTLKANQPFVYRSLQTGLTKYGRTGEVLRKKWLATDGLKFTKSGTPYFTTKHADTKEWSAYEREDGEEIFVVFLDVFEDEVFTKL
jgi:hypothetical protein